MLKREERSIHRHREGYNGGRRRVRRLRHDPSAFTLVRSVANLRRVALPDLLRVTRGNSSVAEARRLAMYLVHVQLGRPLEEVAFLFGRDRTTVAYACQLMEDRRDAIATEVEIARIASDLHVLGARRGRKSRHGK